MKKILIFAGTTEGRILSEMLAEAGIFHTVSVATEYGEQMMQEHPYVQVLCGRMLKEAMVRQIQESQISMVIDATHTYADEVTEHIKWAAKNCNIDYLRLRREFSDPNASHVRYFLNHQDCARALEELTGPVLLTIGSKNLGVYSRKEELRNRLYVRVLPNQESLKICQDCRIKGSQILALQGPFSVELNEVMIRQFNIRCLVTKESGNTGGYPEKIEAARRTGIPVYVVGHERGVGASFSEVCQELERYLGCSLKPAVRFQITLAGIGMGNRKCQTIETDEVIRSADILLGAKRMIEDLTPGLEKRPFYRAEEIIPYLMELQNTRLRALGFWNSCVRVAILFSGDSSFYSGCSRLYQELLKAAEKSLIQADVRIFPGISSVSYLASCIGESYEDSAILSMHGRTVLNLAKRIAHADRTFLLMSGTEDLKQIGKLLQNARLNRCQIIAGYRLSQPDQNILHLTPESAQQVHENGLVTCLIKNPDAVSEPVCHGIMDTELVRGKVPMTKEEVREVIICKLRLKNDSVVYDIGSGTGSIAIEMASLSDQIQVYAIERKAEAVHLIQENKEKFGLENIKIIEGEAPEILEELPVPTHAFIGGSGGKMEVILDTLYERNPSMRIVLSAVSMESIGELNKILKRFPMEQEQVVQIQVSRVREAGSYHLMQAENPVWICAFDFIPNETEGRREDMRR